MERTIFDQLVCEKFTVKLDKSGRKNSSCSLSMLTALLVYSITATCNDPTSYRSTIGLHGTLIHYLLLDYCGILNIDVYFQHVKLYNILHSFIFTAVETVTMYDSDTPLLPMHLMYSAICNDLYSASD
jgi:hypothetical protein